MATGSSVRALVSLLTGNIEKQRNARSCPFKLTFPLVYICSAVWNSVLTQHEIVTSCQEIIVSFSFSKNQKEEFRRRRRRRWWQQRKSRRRERKKKKPKLNRDWEKANRGRDKRKPLEYKQEREREATTVIQGDKMKKCDAYVNTNIKSVPWMIVIGAPCGDHLRWWWWCATSGIMKALLQIFGIDAGGFGHCR